MDKQMFYRLLGLMGLVLWLATTAYFGWKIHPSSGVDNMLSTVGAIMAGWGIFGDLSSNLTFTKETNLKTNTVNIVQEPKQDKDAA